MRVDSPNPVMDLVDTDGVATPPAGIDAAAFDALVVDLDGLGRVGDLAVRRRGVVLRLLARGLTLNELETVLPGWSRYLDQR